MTTAKIEGDGRLSLDLRRAARLLRGFGGTRPPRPEEPGALQYRGPRTPAHPSRPSGPEPPDAIVRLLDQTLKGR